MSHRRGGSGRWLAATAVIIGLALYGRAHPSSHPLANPPGGGSTTTASTTVHAGHAAGAARTAVRYALAQVGDPYVYGATGPGAYDCSGLVMTAWSKAGVAIPRTSEQQWAQLPHVSTLQPGDLIFYTGSPIDPPPGHVTMYLGGSKMVEAYGTGVPVRVTAVRPGAWGYAHP